MIDRLTKRKLAMPSRVAADLCKFGIHPAYAPHLDSYDLYLFPILKVVSKSASFPLDKALRKRLEDLTHQLLENEIMIKKRKTRGGLTPGRLSKARGQIFKLLERNAL